MGRKKKIEIEQKYNPHISRGIIAILILVLACIIALSFFKNAGTVGIIIDEWLLSPLFGTAKYTTPVILAILAWFFVKNTEENYKATYGIGSILFFVATASLFHINFEPQEMWLRALDGDGGGIFGMAAWPLKVYLGKPASMVALIGLLLVAILLLLNTGIIYFFSLIKKLFSSAGSLGKTVAEGAELLTNKNKDGFEINNAYSEEKAEKNFFSRKIKPDEDDEDEEDDSETVAAPASNNQFTKKDTPADAWTKKVVIKDLPPLKLLASRKGKPTSGDIKTNARTIQETLGDFKIPVDIGEVRVGPTVTQYSFKPARGVRLSKIAGLTNNLALALSAHPIRIEAPIPGKALVGIEVPNQKTAMVSLKELLESKEFSERKHNMMIALGKDVGGKVWFADLPKMPHLLIAGATGSGKTVCMNTVIMSLLYQNTAETLRMIMVDPKRVELTLYNGIPHLLTPVITNTQQTVNALRWAIEEMDRRFELLAKRGNRDITSFNTAHPNEKLPHIVFIVDELADLMATAAHEVESGIIRLAQMARAVGIHLILATQRPSVDVITGLMKANIPGRIAFSVASLIDSRTILDSPGAEKLLGRGDMLLQTAELSKPVRIQGAFISEEELKNVSRYLKVEGETVYDESIIQKVESGETMSMFGGGSDNRDPMFAQAKKAVLEAKKASASYLQRKLRIGYARAARLIDELEQAGVVGPQDGAKPREIMAQPDIPERPFNTPFPKTMDTGAEFNVFKEDTNEDDFEDDFEENSIDENDAEDIEEDDIDEEFEEELDEEYDDRK